MLDVEVPHSSICGRPPVTPLYVIQQYLISATYVHILHVSVYICIIIVRI